MLRITRSESEDAVTFILEGKLLAAWLDELRLVLASASPNKRVILDLAALSFADASGALLLGGLQRKGVALHAPSPLLSALIAAASA